MDCPHQLFTLKQGFQHFTLLISEVVLHVLAIQREQPELGTGESSMGRFPAYTPWRCLRAPENYRV